MSLVRRLVNVAWFRARRTLEGDPADPGAAELDEELARSAPEQREPPPADRPVEAPRAPKPRRL